MSTPAIARTLVVSAASRHGGTCEIADRIAETLAHELPKEWRVVRGDLSDLRVLDGADAVVLGSAIYYGHWLHSAIRALEYLRESDPTELWLFSTGPVAVDLGEEEALLTADAPADLAGDDEHMVFGGNLDTSKLTFIERVVVKALHVLPGDHRDWADVDAWAAHIASELKSRGSHNSGTKGIPDQDPVL